MRTDVPDQLWQLFYDAETEEDLAEAAWALVDNSLLCLRLDNAGEVTPERKINVAEALLEDPTLVEDIFDSSFWLRH